MGTLAELKQEQGRFNQPVKLGDKFFSGPINLPQQPQENFNKQSVDRYGLSLKDFIPSRTITIDSASPSAKTAQAPAPATPTPTPTTQPNTATLQVKVAQPPTKAGQPLFNDELVGKLIGAESSGNPAAKAIGIDSKPYKGLMGMGKVAWDEVNAMRKVKGMAEIPWSMAHDPTANKEMGTMYLNERVPEILKSLNLPVNPLMVLIYYGGWFREMQRTKGNIDKMDKHARIYFDNVLGPEVVNQLKGSILDIYKVKADRINQNIARK